MILSSQKMVKNKEKNMTLVISIFNFNSSKMLTDALSILAKVERLIFDYTYVHRSNQGSNQYTSINIHYREGR